MSEQSRGKFIVIEGPDGAGSSTQVERISNYFLEKGNKVLVTKEPTNNLIGGLIRGVLTHQWTLDSYAIQLLFCADRAHHLDWEIEPALNRGMYVVVDRYVPSTVVFGASSVPNTSKYGGNYDFWWNKLMELNKPFLVPDLTILLDIDPQVCVDRISMRASKELFEVHDVLLRVTQGYKRFAQEYPNTVLVSAQGSRDEVYARIVNTIEDKLKFSSVNPASATPSL